MSNEALAPEGWPWRCTCPTPGAESPMRAPASPDLTEGFRKARHLYESLCQPRAVHLARWAASCQLVTPHRPSRRDTVQAGFPGSTRHSNRFHPQCRIVQRTDGVGGGHRTATTRHRYHRRRRDHGPHLAQHRAHPRRRPTDGDIHQVLRRPQDPLPRSAGSQPG